MSGKTKDFWSINFGPDEAKNDAGLLEYFVSIPSYHDVVNGKKRFIIGRKGTGKTAILEHIRLNSQNNPMIFVSKLSLRNFPLSYIRDLRDKNLRDKSQFVPIWTFLILTNFAKIVLSDMGARPTHVVDEIRDFINQNFPDECYNIADTLTKLKERQAKVSVAEKWLNYSSSTKDANQLVTSIHYQKVTDALTLKLNQVESDSTYYVLMDELDEGFRADDKNLRLILLSLLRATEDVALTLSKCNAKYLPILGLRSDIFDRLEDNDLNKLDDYVVRLNWRDAEKEHYSLRSIVDARISASLGHIDESDLWNLIVRDKDPGLPERVATIWKLMINRTFERPRDIIKFLKECQNRRGRGKLSIKVVGDAEYKYSAWLYRELRDELHTYLPIWRETLQAITKVGKGKFSANTFKEELKKDRKIEKWLDEHSKDTDYIVSTLFDFGVIGTLSKEGVWLFAYKDEDLSWNPDHHIIVHYGFHKKLKIFRGRY